MAGTAKKSDPKLWEKVKKDVTRSSKGGKPGQWSARKAQMAVQEYNMLGSSCRLLRSGSTTGAVRAGFLWGGGGRAGSPVDKSDPKLWEKVKKDVTRSSKGGKPGQWSARKAQMGGAGHVGLLLSSASIWQHNRGGAGRVPLGWRWTRNPARTAPVVLPDRSRRQEEPNMAGTAKKSDPKLLAVPAMLGSSCRLLRSGSTTGAVRAGFLWGGGGPNMAGTAKKSDPKLWEKVKKDVTRSSKGGKPGQWWWLSDDFLPS
jgi:hypothetical protein